MKINQLSLRIALLVMLMLNLTILSSHLRADTGTCSGQSITLPFTDVAAGNIFFCSIAEAFFSGLTNGTTATTYSPASPVPREQMAAFVSRTLDQSLARGHARAALGEWWTTNGITNRAIAVAGVNPQFLACDGSTVWSSNTTSNDVSRVDIKTHSVICTLSDIPTPEKIVIVSGRVYVASAQSPGRIYVQFIQATLDSSMIQVPITLGDNPVGITYDGYYLWTANAGTGPGTGSISRVSVESNPYSVNTYTVGFNQPKGILFGGASLWVTDVGDASLKRVDQSTGTVVQTIALSGIVGHPVFDGTNLWIPCAGPDQVYVVRGVGGLTGTILAQLTGNGLNFPGQAAFDGERICVPDSNNGSGSVSLWKATDFSQIGVFVIIDGTEYNPRGVCSDGITFFVGVKDVAGSSGLIVRF